MNANLPQPCLPAPSGRLLSANAAAMLACSLLVATTAQAGLVIGAAGRSVRAFDPAADDVTIDNFDRSGRFFETALSALRATSSGARAARVTYIQALQISGAARSSVVSRDGNGLYADTSFGAQFTVTDFGMKFFGSAAVDADVGAQNFARFSLVQFGPGNGNIVDFTGSQDGNFSGTLDPGNYALSAQAFGNSSPRLDADNAATFNFSITFLDPTAAQPVPEPSSLAMALLGPGGLARQQLARRRNAARAALRQQKQAPDPAPATPPARQMGGLPQFAGVAVSPAVVRSAVV